MARAMPAFADHPAEFKVCQRAGIYRGLCVYVVDGDTVDILIDLGFLQYSLITVRLYGANTPEINSGDNDERVRGLAAKDRVKGLLLNKTVVIKTFKDKRSFGRYVADVWFSVPPVVFGIDPNKDPIPLDGQSSEWTSLKELLIKEQHASRL